MTLGGFALAVGFWSITRTVVIENIERHVGMGEGLEPAIIDGAGEIRVPTLLSTLSICIVFVPVFLLQGTANISSRRCRCRCALAAGQPGALVHAGAGDVQVPDAVVGREARSRAARAAASVRTEQSLVRPIRSSRSTTASKGLQRLPQRLPQRAGLGGCPAAGRRSASSSR